MASAANFDFQKLIDAIEAQAALVNAQLETIKGAKDSVSISDMFKMQLMMNKLSQLSEMSGAVFSAANSSVMSLARNVKG